MCNFVMSNGKKCSAPTNEAGLCRYVKHNINKIIVSENVLQNIPTLEEQITETDMSPNQSAQAIIVMERQNKEEASDKTNAITEDASAECKSLYNREDIESETKINNSLIQKLRAQVESDMRKEKEATLKEQQVKYKIAKPKSEQPMSEQPKTKRENIVNDCKSDDLIKAEMKIAAANKRLARANKIEDEEKRSKFITANQVSLTEWTAKRDALLNKRENIENLTDKALFKFLKSSFDDTTIIEYFLKIYNKYKSYNNVLYCFNGSYWIKGSNQYIIDDIDDMYRNLYTVIQSNFQDEDLIKFLKKIMCLRSIKYKETLIKGIIGYVQVDHDLWDLNNDLIGFRNGVYDLLNDTFRAGAYNDYITMIIDYDYALSPIFDLQLVESYFQKIMPIEEERDLLLLLLSTILSGRHLEKFIVCTGIGRNGKDSLFTYLMKHVMGPYYYGCNPNAITQKVKSDQNVSIANFNKKRIVITSEPESEDTIKTSMIKALTGSDQIAMRSLYSTDTKVNLNQTLFMLCNDKPALDKCEQAILERLIVIPFRSTFKSEAFMKEHDLKEGENNVYQASEHVKSDIFLDQMKLPTFNYILKWYKKFKQDGYLIQSIPNSIKALNESYLEESDEFMSWFNSQYEKTTKKDDYIKISDIFTNYSTSDFYFNLSKKEKRNNNKSKFIEKISTNLSLRIFYKAAAYPYIENKQVCIRNVITNYKTRQDHLDDDNDNN